MFNLIELFEESTGLHSFYKWSRHTDIPKELIFTILVVHKSLPKCVYCAMGCCANRPYNTGHHYNGTPLRKIVEPFFDKLDANARGKIIVLALSDFRYTMLRDARECLDRLFARVIHVCVEPNNLVPISTFDCSYNTAFTTIGSALHDIHDVVDDHPHKQKYQNKDTPEISKTKLKSYFHRIGQHFQESQQHQNNDKLEISKIKSKLYFHRIEQHYFQSRNMTNAERCYARMIDRVSVYFCLCAIRTSAQKMQLQKK